MKKFIFLITFLLFILVVFINGSPFIFGDGYGYYHNTKTLVDNGNFVQRNAPEYFSYTGHAVLENNGEFITPYPPGSSILLWPFLSISKYVPSGTVYNDYYKAFNGHSLADGVAILVAASFYTFLSFVLIYKLLKELSFSDKVSYISTLCVFLGGFVISYTTQFAAYSHVYEIFVCSLMIYALIKFGKRFEYRNMFISGLMAGLLVLIRPVDLVLVIPIIIYLIIYRNWKSKFLFVLGAVPSAVIFFLYNLASYGNAFSTGYGANEKLFDFTRFNLVNLLFSDVRGWYIYSPIMILACIGLILYARKTIPSFLIYLAPSILLILTYSFWPNWWGGDSLGQRFFMVLTPFMAIGLGNLLRMKSYELRVTNKVVGVIKQILSKGLIILIVFFTLYSVILAVTYRFTKTDVLYSRNVYTSLKYPEVTPAERFSPQDIFADHLTILWENNYDLKKYYEHLQQSFNGGRSLLLLGLGQTDPLAKIEKINDFQFNLHLLANNDYKFDVSSIKVGIELRDKYELFTINNLLKDESFQIYFDCSNKMNCKSNWDGAQLTFQNRDKIEGLKDPIEFSNELKIDLSSSSKINFVDYKTKN